MKRKMFGIASFVMAAAAFSMPAAAPAQDLEISDVKPPCITPVTTCVDYYIDRAQIIADWAEQAVADTIGDVCWAVLDRPCTL